VECAIVEHYRSLVCVLIDNYSYSAADIGILRLKVEKERVQKFLSGL